MLETMSIIFWVSALTALVSCLCLAALRRFLENEGHDRTYYVLASIATIGIGASGGSMGVSFIQIVCILAKG